MTSSFNQDGQTVKYEVCYNANQVFYYKIYNLSTTNITLSTSYYMTINPTTLVTFPGSNNEG